MICADRICTFAAEQTFVGHHNEQVAWPGCSKLCLSISQSRYSGVLASESSAEEWLVFV